MAELFPSHQKYVLLGKTRAAQEGVTEEEMVEMACGLNERPGDNERQESPGMLQSTGCGKQLDPT